MRVRVLCFGRLRELLAPELDLELAGPATVATLLEALRLQHPSLAPYTGSLAVAVNQNFASSSTPLKESDEIALLPPVSGGSRVADLPLVSSHARLQREVLQAASLMAEVKQGEDGAVCLFDGIVRNNTRGRRTLYLEYDAYPAMALAEMEQLALGAIELFPVRDVRIVHRLGRLNIGESSVLIAVASAHRGAAFDACRYLIDTLKKQVPIWKKEFFADGAAWADGEPFPPELTV
jgi:molybdopterin synthase catalytic subunit